MTPVISQLPHVLTLTIADVVHRDPGTGKFSLLGIYNAIAAPAFPCVHPAMGVYLALTDGRGKAPIVLRLVDAEEERPPVFNIAAVLDSRDPTQVMELGYSFQRLEFPKPGEYLLQFLAAGEPLMERRLFVVPVQQPAQRPVRAVRQPYN